jgi:hypothetical protein
VKWKYCNSATQRGDAYLPHVQASFFVSSRCERVKHIPVKSIRLLAKNEKQFFPVSWSFLKIFA